MAYKFDVITIGGAVEDITFEVEDCQLITTKVGKFTKKLLGFEYGTKIKAEHVASTFGGGAANAAVCLAKLGFKVAAGVALGNDGRGKEIIKNFKKHKVNLDFSKFVKNIISGFSIIVTGPKNEHIAFMERGANDFLNFNDKEISKINSYAKWLYISSLSGQWPELLDKILNKNQNIYWNPGLMQLKAGYTKLKKYFNNISVLAVNYQEAILLVSSHKDYKNKTAVFFKKPENLLKAISSWGPKIVVITNGESSVSVYDGENIYHKKVVKADKVIDTTGVGDAFQATFLAGLELFNNNINQALDLALKNSASVVTVAGAQNGLLTKKELI